MARAVKIFGDAARGSLFFEGSPHPPAPLGGIVVASAHPILDNRIRVTRSDQFQKNGVDPRVLFKRMNFGRVRNRDNQRLVDLGFNRQQVIDYINDEANRKANEIDFRRNGNLVGSGNTINFTGNVDSVTVSGDTATISIATTQYVSSDTLNVSGVATASGGFIGTIRSSDVVGLVTSGQIDSIDGSQITGVIGTGQFPITSLGGVNFTPGDSDATPAFNLVDATGYQYSNLTGVPDHATTINDFNWYQQYLSPGAGFSTAGPGITTTNPPEQNNPFYYGVQLKPYQEMVWTHSMSGTGAYWVGKWGGNTSYTPTAAGNVSNWERVLVFRNSNADGHHIDNAGTDLDSQGFGFVNGVSQYTTISNNSSFMRLRYNGDSNKLEIYRGSNTPIGIATADSAEDGNPITISFAISDNANVHLPGITTVQYYVDQTNWKYHNSNKSLENNQHDKDNGVVYYDAKVKRGEELVFSLPSGPLHVGLWNGGTGVTGIANVNDKANWSTKFRYSSEDTRWQNANTTIGKVGIDLSSDIETDAGTFAIRFDYQTEKLQLWNIDTAYDWLAATANAGVGLTETYIYFSSGDNTQTTPPQSLPSVSSVRAQDFTLTSYTDAARPGASLYDGTRVNDVWKSNRSFKNGMKLKFTVPTSAGNQYWSTAFEGTEDLGNGENNAYTAGEMTWRLTNQEKFVAHTDATINSNYTAIDGSTTLAMPGRNMSWRYNSDNTWDLFDEDTDEVVITGDDVLSGDVYPYLLAVNNTTQPLQEYVQFEWDWNAAQWFIEHRDYESGGSGTTLLGKIPNAKPLKTYSQSIPTQAGGYYYLGNARYMVTWGEKMRPGQEFSWTQLADNSNGSNKNNMIIGVLNSDSDAFTAGMRFFQYGAPKEQADQDSGFTVSAGIGTATATAGTSMRLQYEYGTNKLVCYSLNAGVRTKLAESTSALDGNPIFITLGGESTRIPTTQGVSVYGWEIAHEPPGYYNPWNNWRIGGFPENSGVTVGIATTGGVLAHKADQVWRHKDGLASGYKMHWQLPTTATNTRFGIWKTGNASSGLTNVENSTGLWDWSWRLNTSEEIMDLDGMTFNTSNSNYTATKWVDPNPGSTKFSIRYHANNTLDIFDESNSEIIATKDADCDGNPIFISSGPGGAMNNSQQLIDDFFGGGDVGIALTTTAV